MLLEALCDLPTPDLIHLASACQRAYFSIFTTDSMIGRQVQKLCPVYVDKSAHSYVFTSMSPSYGCTPESRLRLSLPTKYGRSQEGYKDLGFETVRRENVFTIKGRYSPAMDLEIEEIEWALKELHTIGHSPITLVAPFPSLLKEARAAVAAAKEVWKVTTNLIPLGLARGSVTAAEHHVDRLLHEHKCSRYDFMRAHAVRATAAVIYSELACTLEHKMVARHADGSHKIDLNIQMKKGLNLEREAREDHFAGMCIDRLGHSRASSTRVTRSLKQLK